MMENIILTELLNIEKVNFLSITDFVISSVVTRITNIISELCIKKNKFH